MYPSRNSESSNAQTALRDSVGRRHHSTPQSDASTPPRRSQRIAAANTPRRNLGDATPATPRKQSRKEAPATPTRCSGRILRPSLKSIEAASTPSRRNGRAATNKNKGKAVSAPVSSSSSSGGSRRRAARKSTGVRERLPIPEFTLNHEPEKNNHPYSNLSDLRLPKEEFGERMDKFSGTMNYLEKCEEEATFHEMLRCYTRFGEVQLE